MKTSVAQIVWERLRRPPCRTLAISGAVLLLLGAAYTFWKPGLDVRDGQHDRGRNGLWLAHGWLGADSWFVHNGKADEFRKYRDLQSIQALADRLERHNISDVFPHLCPADSKGNLPPVDPAQAERFLDALVGIRVLPWIGGLNGGDVRLNSPGWISTFTNDVATLLRAHPRLAGVHLNIEPLASGDTNFLSLLEELRLALPSGKLLSVAAYPPPTGWHPYPDVHWNQQYFREVARRCDQMAVMMYDAGQRIPKTYQKLIADWTREVLAWSDGTPVLLGLPAYDDSGVGYHHPEVENLTNALLGVHRGLSSASMPTNYQGVALYADWETSDEEWSFLRTHFLQERLGP